MQNAVQTVVVLGASPKPWRYAFQAVRVLDGAGVPWEHACTLVPLRTGQF